MGGVGSGTGVGGVTVGSKGFPGALMGLGATGVLDGTVKSVMALAPV